MCGHTLIFIDKHMYQCNVLFWSSVDVFLNFYWRTVCQCKARDEKPYKFTHLDISRRNLFGQKCWCILHGQKFSNFAYLDFCRHNFLSTHLLRVILKFLPTLLLFFLTSTPDILDLHAHITQTLLLEHPNVSRRSSISPLPSQPLLLKHVFACISGVVARPQPLATSS